MERCFHFFTNCALHRKMVLRRLFTACYNLP